MLLKKVLNNIDYEVICGDIDKDIVDISYDSRSVKDDYMFVAMSGFMVDGSKYVEDAVKNGASVVVVEKDIDSIDGVTIIKVKDARRSLATMSRNFFECPDKELVTIGITGTKGKTTTSISIYNILNEHGYNAGVIGTMGVFYKDKFYHTNNTSPESYDVYKYMREMINNGIKYFIMEVSSQSLKLHRWEDMIFNYGLFTNLSLDHVGKDEHDSYDDYVYCKSLLFKQCEVGIFNTDDKEYPRISKYFNGKMYSFGKEGKKDIKLESCKNIISSKFIGIEMEVSGLIEDKFKVSIPGTFNAFNMMGAMMVCNLLGLKNEEIKETLEHISVKGRLENIYVSDKFKVLIDYAYQGIAMENVINTIREANPKRIVVLFGCGGNRSKHRRYDCGRIASSLADFCIITSDNPRYESNDDIVKDIMSTYDKKCPYIIINDRRDAIKYSIVNAREGDVIMILGKGHEDYQEINGVRNPFDERVVIKEILDNLTEEEKGSL